MQYIKLKKQEVEEGMQPIFHEDYERIEYLKVKNLPAILPFVYYAELHHIGKVCKLKYQEISLEE